MLAKQGSRVFSLKSDRACELVARNLRRSFQPRPSQVDSSRQFSATAKVMCSKVLTIDNLNPNVKNVEYAVRGPIVQIASDLEKDLQSVGFIIVTLHRLPFLFLFFVESLEIEYMPA